VASGCQGKGGILTAEPSGSSTKTRWTAFDSHCPSRGPSLEPRSPSARIPSH